MANPEWGEMRVCPKCGIKWYPKLKPDGNPFSCPGCNFGVPGNKIFRDWEQDKPGEIIRLGNYYPTSDKKHNDYSKSILAVKENDPQAIKKFCRKINDTIADDVSICTIPGHDANKPGSGIRELVRNLVRMGRGRLDATSALKRVKTISKLARGGNRSEETHLQSIECVQQNLVRGKLVLLLDDITTTGNSMHACEKILKPYDLRKLGMLVLGKTTRS